MYSLGAFGYWLHSDARWLAEGLISGCWGRRRRRGRSDRRPGV